MSSRTISTLPQADVLSHNTAKSCYVTIGNKVYDITDFVDDHPGGGHLILEYGGKDVKEIMADEISHEHSEAAYEVLDDSFLGYVADDKVMEVVKESDEPDEIVPFPPTADGARELKANGITNKMTNGALDGAPRKTIYAATGMSSADDLSKETDFGSDYKAHKFLDLGKPLLPQVWNGGFSKDFYLEQVHRPRHYKGGASAPLFGNFLEPLTKTQWYIVPAVWLPPVIYGTVLAGQNLSSLFELACYWFLGLAIWTFVEYGLHRCLFHVDNYLPDNRVGITLHFLLHGIHHYLPMDRLRLVMPPTLFALLATPFWKLAQTVFFYNWYAATAVYCGGIFGYICYDLTHYFLHHKK